MDEERYVQEKEYYSVASETKKTVNYRLMKEN